METTIYSSSNEQGFLKSVGPYRIVTADLSFSGNATPQTVKWVPVIVIDTTQVYGANQLQSQTLDHQVEQAESDSENEQV